MRLLIWNMGNGFGGSPAKHERAWQYLDTQEADVALLQETWEPPVWAHERWASLFWKPKFGGEWGCAVAARSLELHGYEPDDSFPWLRELRGSSAIARSAGDPRWLVSVHLRASMIPASVVALHSIEGVKLTTPGGSVWEQNLIPHELRRLFADETFVWGGDFNCEPGMDGKPGFLGGNHCLFEMYAKSGFHDTRARCHDSYLQTFFKPGKGAYQLDHVFADARTEQRVTHWEVDPRPATQQQPYSDHAPIVVTLAPSS
jgi:endonuclease/exonuclease/phosphatase family protein